MQSGVLREPESWIRHDSKKSIGSRSLEGLSTLGRLGLEDLCYLCTPTLFSSGSISTWRGGERFFAEFFDFLLDNTS